METWVLAAVGWWVVGYASSCAMGYRDAYNGNCDFTALDLLTYAFVACFGPAITLILLASLACDLYGVVTASWGARVLVKKRTQ